MAKRNPREPANQDAARQRAVDFFNECQLRAISLNEAALSTNNRTYSQFVADLGEYATDEEVLETLEAAKVAVECRLVGRLVNGGNTTGCLNVLKRNHGWTDLAMDGGSGPREFSFKFSGGFDPSIPVPEDNDYVEATDVTPANESA